MAESLILKVKPREVGGKSVRKLRKQGLLPLVLYGHGIETKPLSVKKVEFEHILKEAGSSTLLDLELENGKKEADLGKVLIHDTQTDAITDEIIHADLLAVSMTEKLQTEIPLKIVGEAPAVKELQGNLITNKDAIRVETLPQHLVSEIEVDVSILKTFEGRIYVKDLDISKEIEVLEDPEEVLIFVEPPRSEEELAELEEEVAAKEEKEAIEKIEEEATKPEEEKEEKEGKEKPVEGKVESTSKEEGS